MNSVTMAAFLDELEKIGANLTPVTSFSSALGKPSVAKFTSGAIKPQTKLTNYSTVNTGGGGAATSTAVSPPPPPVVA